MKRLSIPFYHPNDPEWPWTEEYNPVTLEDAYFDESDRITDNRLCDK